MKDAIQEITKQADYWLSEAKHHRNSGDHIAATIMAATIMEKRGKNLHKIAKLARAIFIK